MGAGDFTGFDFAVGSVHGLRAWRVDAAGRLRGVSFREQKWLPGVNEAECATTSCGCPACTTLGTLVVDYLKGDPSDGRHFAAHRCGFYAYYAHEGNDYLPALYAPQAQGVIEGYGNTVLGSKGFRCTKARIVALCLPDPSQEVGLFSWVWAVRDFIPDSDPNPLATPFGPQRFDFTARYQRVRENYPDVPFYDDVETMLAAHPPSPIPEPVVDALTDPHHPHEWASGE